MTPATAQPLAFESEGNAGNTDENFREHLAVERLGRRRRLGDSIRTAGEFAAGVNPSRDYHIRRSIDPRIEDGPSGRQRVGEDNVARDLVAMSFVEDDRG